MRCLLTTTFVMLASLFTGSVTAQETDSYAQKLSFYYYEDPDGRLYELTPTEGELLLHIKDASKKCEGYSLMDESDLESMFKTCQTLGLISVKETDFTRKDDTESPQWKAIVSVGTPSKEKTYYCWGYTKSELSSDPSGMAAYKKRVEQLNTAWRDLLKKKQKLYGKQKVVMMKYGRHGGMVMMRTENGKNIMPYTDFHYFNYGSHALIKNEWASDNIYEKTHVTTDRKVGDTVGSTIEIKKYKKPDPEWEILDAPSNSFTFYLFDGRKIDFDTTYIQSYDTWDVPNAGELLEYLSSMLSNEEAKIKSE